jgi:hypothetical protein
MAEIKVVNVSTGEETQRQMNDDEQDIFDSDLQTIQSENSQRIAKAEARSAAEEKLLALGLTTDDLKALLG